jgi:hypothetical protein
MSVVSRIVADISRMRCDSAISNSCLAGLESCGLAFLPCRAVSRVPFGMTRLEHRHLSALFRGGPELHVHVSSIEPDTVRYKPVAGVARGAWRGLT